MSNTDFDSASSFWQGRRVFVTGHTGFKGSWLTAWLLQMQAQVRGFALPPAMAGVPEGRQSFFDELGLAVQIDHVPGDVRDQEALRQAVKGFDPEIVIHMAAQPMLDAGDMTAWTADWYQGQTPEQRNATTAQQISEYRRRLAAA